MSRILGLDLGTNSIGWAIVDTQEDGSYKLFDKGVSIFQEGVKIEKGNESSKAAERTGYRSARRRIFRRKLRKIETLKVLVDLGWCPYLSIEQLADWRYKDIYPKEDEFILWQRTSDNEQNNPYYYRYLALTQKLDLSKKENKFILGRVMYHLSQRRGFLSNRKDNTKESDGKVTKGISDLKKAIEDRGCKYLGEYFYTIYGKERIRAHYTSRQEYKDEFDAICAKQGISEDVKTRLEKAIFFQRPLKSQKGSVGHCKFETRKTRCPISHPRFEEFRMWSFINNIKIRTPYDEELRSLNAEEIVAILPLFFRKSRKQFPFEDIAKALSAKGQYAYCKDSDEKPYRFNFKMFTTVSGCPVITGFKEIFGDNWEQGICEKYSAKKTSKIEKTTEQILNDVWHSLFFFSDDEKLIEWAKAKLGLTEEEALKFSKIPVGSDYSSLSLKAINKMLAFLKRGFKYSHAVFLANIASIVPKEIYSNPENRKIIEREVGLIVDNPSLTRETTEQRILEFLMDNFDLGNAVFKKKLYHPSMIEVYSTSKSGYLGSPRTNSFKNPMAMRSLFRLRALVNDLIKNDEVDKNTKIHIEYSRSLNDANKRKALERYQRDREKKNAEYREEIIKHYREHGVNAEPTKTDIEKYRLWEEQGHICLYTGKNINVSQFLGSNPQFDIEHTIPRSLGGEDALENKTLCENKFNREIKKDKIPSQLANHNEILVRLEPVKEKIEELRKQIEKYRGRYAATKEERDNNIQRRRLLEYEKNYLSDKYGKFLMKEVPSDYRKNQDIDNSIISKYARPYLKTVFNHIYTIKGLTTSQFRKMWGLQEDEKKDRSTFLNHTVDAITIACIGPKEYSAMANYYHKEEECRWFGKERPSMPKPWPTFTEDVMAINKEVLVSHYTPDNLKKRTYKRLRKRGVIQKGEDGKPLMTQGDTARGALHMDTYYGAIQRGDEIKYVVRKALSSLEKADISKIVDDVVRQKVEQAIEEKGFKEAMAGPVWMNKGKGIQIKKVRIFTSVSNPIHLKEQRDQSRFEHKRQFNVANDRNYCMGIYEGTDEKGKVKRSFKLLNNLNATGAVNEGVAMNMVPPEDSNGYKLKHILKIGTMVLLYENNPEEVYEANAEELTRRLYKVVGLSLMLIQRTYEYGVATLLYNQEARPSKDIKAKNGLYKQGEELRSAIIMNHNQINALVEGFDFTLSPSGKIHFIRH